MATNTRVNLRAFLGALGDSAPDAVYYVDSHNGEVLKITRSTPMAELARFKTASDRDPDRYLKVPRPTGEESYGDMDAFTATVKDKKLQERLVRQLRGGGTARDFVDALTPHPLEKERWYKFRDARLQGRAQLWLRANGLTVG